MTTDYQVTFIVIVSTENEDEAEDLARQTIRDPHFSATEIEEILGAELILSFAAAGVIDRETFTRMRMMNKFRIEPETIEGINAAMDGRVGVFYTIVNKEGLHWNHAGNDTYNVMDATWFDTEGEAKYTLEELDVSYVGFQTRKCTIEQQPIQ